MPPSTTGTSATTSDEDEKLKILAEYQTGDHCLGDHHAQQVSTTGLDQRSDTFPTLRPLAADNGNGERVGLAPIFKRRTPGLKTNRDAWCYNSSAIQKLRSQYPKERGRSTMPRSPRSSKTNPTGTLTERAKAAKAVRYEETLISSTGTDRSLQPPGQRPDLHRRGRRLYHQCTYRPFFKQNACISTASLNSSVREFPQIYPNREADNLGISF